jgi:hypothetical protein
VIGLRQDASVEADRSVYFASDETAFRLVLRLNGQPLNSLPTTLRDGTTQVSRFVALGAR